MKIQLYLLVFSICIASHSYSQQNIHSVIASAGDISKSENTVLEWTLGEPVIESGSSLSSLFTQGFHQPSLDVQRIDNRRGSLVLKILFHVFPNPATSVLNIQLNTIQDNPLLVTFTDATGKVLITSSFPAKTSILKLNVGRFSHGLYFLRLTNKEGTVQSEFKVIKAH